MKAYLEVVKLDVCDIVTTSPVVGPVDPDETERD